MKKYLVIGGTITSKKDGDEHYVNAREVCRLYGVDPKECILTEETDKVLKSRMGGLNSMLILRPRWDGNYDLQEMEIGAARISYKGVGRPISREEADQIIYKWQLNTTNPRKRITCVWKGQWYDMRHLTDEEVDKFCAALIGKPLSEVKQANIEI